MDLSNITTVSYVIGNLFFLIALYFLMFSKKSYAPNVVYKFGYDRAKVAAAALLIGMIAVFEFMYVPKVAFDNAQLVLMVTFWSMFLLFQLYMTFRQKVIAEDGVGTVDFRGKAQRDFYTWNDVEKYTVEDKKVVFYIKSIKGIIAYVVPFKTDQQDEVKNILSDNFKKGKPKKASKKEMN